MTKSGQCDCPGIWRSPSLPGSRFWPTPPPTPSLTRPSRPDVPCSNLTNPGQYTHNQYPYSPDSSPKTHLPETTGRTSARPESHNNLCDKKCLPAFLFQSTGFLSQLVPPARPHPFRRLLRQ